MERLDVNSALLHISILMEHRGAGGYDKRMADDPIYCLSNKFFPSYWFPISMSQIYHPRTSRPPYCLQEPKLSTWRNSWTNWYFGWSPFSASLETGCLSVKMIDWHIFTKKSYVVEWNQLPPIGHCKMKIFARKRHIFGFVPLRS